MRDIEFLKILTVLLNFLEVDSFMGKSDFKKTEKFRFWSFTDYNETTEYRKFEDGCPTFAVWQLEKCPTSGRIHAQGHIEFKNSVSLTYAKKLLSFSAHLKPCKNRLKSIKYCMKEETRVSGPYLFGNNPISHLNPKDISQNSNSQFETSEQDKEQISLLKKIIDDGQTEEEIAIKYYPLFKKHKDIIKLFLKNRKVEDVGQTRAKLILVQGSPGTGKSTLTNELAKKRGIKKYNYNGKKWFDGYLGEPILHMDEVMRGSFTVTEINNLVDGYTKRGEVKGGYVPLSIKEIVMISNYPFDSWVPVKSKESLNALHRRADLLFLFNHDEKKDKDGDSYCTVNIIRKDPSLGGKIIDDFKYRYLYTNSFQAAEKLASILISSPLLKDCFFFPKDFVHQTNTEIMNEVIQRIK